MRRTMLLLATVGLTLLLVGGVAVSEQRQEIAYSKSHATATKNGGDDVPARSLTQKASSTTGSGGTFLRVSVSDAGNLLNFESPQGARSVSREGYALCSGGFDTVHGYDIASEQAGFGPPTFSQPNGRGAFPLTVTRNTVDGKLQLKQVWAKPDTVEKDVTVTMTAKNRTSSKISSVVVSRFGDFDAGGFDTFGNGYTDRGSRTHDSVFQWDDYGDGGAASIGLMLTALDSQTFHIPYVESLNGWSPLQCNGSSTVFGPESFNARQDLAMRMIYFVGDIGGGASKTVKFEYGRM